MEQPLENMKMDSFIFHLCKMQNENFGSHIQIKDRFLMINGIDSGTCGVKIPIRIILAYAFLSTDKDDENYMVYEVLTLYGKMKVVVHEDHYEHLTNVLLKIIDCNERNDQEKYERRIARIEDKFENLIYKLDQQQQKEEK